MSSEIVPLVMRDLERRYQVGMERYGVSLTTATEKDALVEAYEEALDLCVYLRLELERRDPAAEPIPSMPLLLLRPRTHEVALTDGRTFGPDGLVRRVDTWARVTEIRKVHRSQGTIWNLITSEGEAAPIYTNNDGSGFLICARPTDG